MQLTDQQRAAVESTATTRAILAGAGSGKTRVAVAIVENLLTSRGVSAGQVLAITFTRRAAGELIKRLGESLGDKIARRVTATTLHSWCLSLLQSRGEAVGYRPPITVVPDAQAKALLAKCYSDLGYKTHTLQKANLNRSMQRYASTGEMPPEGATRRVMREYQTRLLTANAVDYGMLQVKALEILRDGDIYQAVRNQWPHVVVDEAQDCDTVQWEIIHLMSPQSNNARTLSLVGDVRQSIYGWRGSKPEKFLDFIKIMIGGRFSLDCNYRSSRGIVDAANKIMPPPYIPMVYGTFIDGGIESFHGRSATIVDMCHNLCKDGDYAFDDIAILGRTNRQLKRIESLLIEDEVPCQRVGADFDICECHQFQEILATLRLIVNPSDTLARQLGRPTVTSDSSAISIGIAAALHDSEIDLVSRALVNGFWSEHCDGMSVQEALDWYATRDSQDGIRDAGNGVTLSTVHSAKGLEWPIVIMAGCNDDNFPSKKGDVEEERRVFYVGCTRAKEQLWLHYRLPQDCNADRPYVGVSRFITEAGLPLAPGHHEEAPDA